MCAVPLGHAAEKEYVPKLTGDVEKFKERRDLCDHFRGEDPYDEQRKKFLEENLKKYCTGTDKELASLKAKYKNNKTLMKVLEKYDEKIESDNWLLNTRFEAQGKGPLRHSTARRQASNWTDFSINAMRA